MRLSKLGVREAVALELVVEEDWLCQHVYYRSGTRS